ncbi:MAG: VWA domain-containing protein [Chloroflexi bacterium]|nr:VWA domain-containing protein [Chloroflexota bacterium]
MTFLWGWALPVVLLVPLLAFLYWRAQRRRNRYALRYASLSLVREAVGKGPGRKRHVPPVLFLIALFFMLVALARPVAVVTLPNEEGVVILAMDVSGSMFAEDLAPNRMEAAKDAAKRFVERQRSNDKVRVGVVAFSDAAVIVQPPTTDRDAAIAAISRLRPQRGTAIGRGILASLDALVEGSDAELPSESFNQAARAGTLATPPPPLPAGVYAPATIILLTDGENNQPPAPLALLEHAKNRGVRIHTIGVGTAAGTVLRIQGRAIRTVLDEATLKAIAAGTDTQYFNAQNLDELRTVYENLGAKTIFRTEKTEISSLFTALAALFALVAGAFSLAYFNRLP